jgi:ribosome biogenesis GTPase
LHRYVEPGQTAVLLGSSGAGKSTILNRLLQAEVQRAQPVRERDSRGRHTTTGRQMFLLSQGWLLIDTPGLRELEPWAGAEAASAVFGDIEELARQCRFRDCLHRGEPGCAVARAIEEGVLDMARLGNFQKLRAGAERLERMQDIHAAQAEKRKWKQIHKAMRNYSKW